MGNCCGKKNMQFWRRNLVKNVDNKSLTPDEYLEGSDGCYDNGAIPMRAMVFVTPKYIRKFPKFTMPPFFRVSNSTSTEDINQSSSHAGGLSLNQNQGTPVSFSTIQHSTLPEYQDSVASENPLTNALDSSEFDQLEHHPLQTTSSQSASETDSRHHVLELEQHQSSSVQSLSETGLREQFLDSKNFRKIQTLSRNIEIAKLDGIPEVRDGAIVFLPPKYVKNFLESTRPPSFGVQITNSNSTENFNQTSTNSSGISSDLNQIPLISATQHSSVPEHQQSVSSEHALITGQDSPECDQHLLEHDPNKTTSKQSSSETESVQHYLELELQQSTSAPSSSETESRKHLLDAINVRNLQIPAENDERMNLDEIGARVFLTPQYVKDFPESTIPPYFDDKLTNSNSTEIINQTLLNATEISSNQNHVTPVSSPATQNSTEPEHHYSITLEHPSTTAQNSSETEIIEPEAHQSISVSSESMQQRLQPESS